MISERTGSTTEADKYHRHYMRWLTIIHIPVHEGDPCLCRGSWKQEAFEKWKLKTLDMRS